MKSKLFAKILVPPEKFSKAIKRLSELPVECLDEWAIWFNNLKIMPRRLDSIPQYPVDTVQALCIKSSVSTDEFWELIDNITFVMRDVFREQDDIHAIVDDMVAQGLVIDSNAGKLHHFFLTKYYKKD